MEKKTTTNSEIPNQTHTTSETCYKFGMLSLPSLFLKNKCLIHCFILSFTSSYTKNCKNETWNIIHKYMTTEKFYTVD